MTSLLLKFLGLILAAPVVAIVFGFCCRHVGPYTDSAPQSIIPPAIATVVLIVMYNFGLFLFKTL